MDFGAVRLEPGLMQLAHLVLMPQPARTIRAGISCSKATAWCYGVWQRLTYGNVGIYRPEFFAGFGSGRFPLLEPLRRAISAKGSGAR